MAVTGAPEVAAVIDKVISNILTNTLMQESVALAIPGIWDRSGEVGAGMDTLDMITVAELAEQAVNEDGTPMTPQTLNPSAESLLLNQHKSIPFSITKKGALQSKIALVSKAIEQGARTLAYGIDNYVFGLAVTEAGTTVTVAAADGLAAIREFAKAMDLAKVPKFGRAIAVSPGFLHDELLATSNVIKANEFGSSEPVKMGAVVTIYGVQVYESTSSNIPDDGFIGFGLEALAFARQRSLELESEAKVLEQRTDYAMTHLFGAKSTTAATNARIYVYNPV